MLSKTINRLILGLIILLSTVVLSSTNSSALAEGIDPATLDAKIENLHGFQLTEKTATILVTSTGCTVKEDFVAVLQQSQPPAATFIRLKPDFCRAASHLYPIKFSLQEVGAKEFTITNLITPSPAF